MKRLIRKARPGDKKEVAGLIHVATSSHLNVGIFDYILGTSKEETIKYLESLFTTMSRSWNHWSYSHVAEINGKVAANTTAYSEDETGLVNFIIAFGEVLLNWKLSDINKMRKRAEILNNIKPSAPPDRWILEYVAVFPEYRGRGLISDLFDEALQEGKDKGYKQAQISFAIGNSKAEKVYKKLGFQFDHDSKDPEFEKIFGSPGLRVFVKKL